MTFDFDGRIEELQETYRAQRESLSDLHRTMNELTATAESPKREVEVTVGATDDKTSITIRGNAHQSMPAQEFAALLVATLNEARQAFQAELLQSMPPSPFPGVSTADVVRGDFDWSELLPTDPISPENWDGDRTTRTDLDERRRRSR
ncbi:MAG: YbaB/EbfC family nucleoid-associated protein [Actinomycetota bacterium]